MKLEKAILILEEMHSLGTAPYDDDSSDALKLGIEALKLVRLNRKLWGDTEAFTLPGETKD